MHMQFVVGIYIDENVYTYHTYISSTACHMQLQVGYRLSYTTMPNVVIYGVCKLEFITTNTNCKTKIFF